VRRRRYRFWSLAVVGILLLAGVSLGAAVRVGGYCGADLVPLEVELETAPYVQNVTSDAATVMWRTPDDADGVVAFGESPALGQTLASEATTVHAVRLSGLQPDREYFYQVQSGDTLHDIQSFHTAPGPDRTVTAAVVGDTGSGEPPQWAVAEVMRQTGGLDDIGIEATHLPEQLADARFGLRL
jgi:hypothetical protein